MLSIFKFFIFLLIIIIIIITGHFSVVNLVKHKQTGVVSAVKVLF